MLSQGLGMASITFPGAQLCHSSSSKALLFISFSETAAVSSSCSPGTHKGRARKLCLCIISSPGWQGREHKPVQAHCSRSALAKSRAIELLCSCCSQHSSSPILLQNPPQHSFRGWLTAPTPLNSELECAWLHTKPLLLPALQGMGTHQTQISLSKLSPSA